MTRIPIVPADEMDDEQRSLMTEQQSQLSLFQLCARHPEVLRRLKATGSFANRETQIPDRDRELMILRWAWSWQSGFEWGQHHAIAQRAGLTVDDIERIKDGPDATAWSGWERAVLSAADGLADDCTIPDDAWAVLRTEWTEETMLEVVILFGHYTMVATFANSFGLPVPPGKPGLDGQIAD